MRHNADDRVDVKGRCGKTGGNRAGEDHLDTATTYEALAGLTVTLRADDVEISAPLHIAPSVNGI